MRVKTAEQAGTWFRFFSVDPPLNRYVSYLYASVHPREFTDQVFAVRLPELQPQLVFSVEEGQAFPGARFFAEGVSASLFVQAAHLEVIPIPGTMRSAVGASLLPAGLRLLFASGAGDLSASPLIPLEDLWGQRARDLRERLLEAQEPLARVAVLNTALSALAREATQAHVSAKRAIDLMATSHGELSVEALARNCGVTSRTLRNVLLAETGLPPKHVARIVRIRRSLESMRHGDRLESSELRAFSDAAHQCREFRSLLAASPAELARELRSSQGRLPGFASERELLGTGLLLRPRR